MSLVDVVPLPRRLTNLLAHARPTERAAGSWFRIDNADGADGDADEATLFVYDEVGWYGVTDAAFAEALSAVTARRLTVRLNSPGGSVFQGIAVANLLRSHPAYVTMSVDGLAASIASVIMLAGDEIVVQPQSQVMVHKASGLCLGDDDDMEEMRDLLRRQSENIARAYASRAGGRWDSWYNRMAAETWFSAEEAVAVGLADRVAQYPRKGRPAPTEDEPEPDMATAAKAAPRIWDLSVFRYAGRDAAPKPDLSNDGPSATAAADLPIPPAGPGPSATTAGGDIPPRPLSVVEIRGAMHEEAADLAAGLAAGLTAALRTAFAEAGLSNTAVGPHEGTAQDGTWDADAQLKRLSWPIPVATARRVFAWYDGMHVEDGKIARAHCSLPHHFVSEDGTPGAPSRNGINAALARLDQTHGPTDAEKETIRRHLRAHLPDGDSDDKADVGLTPAAADATAATTAADPPATEPAEPAPVPVLTFGRPRPDHTARTVLAFGKGGAPK